MPQLRSDGPISVRTASRDARRVEFDSGHFALLERGHLFLVPCRPTLERHLGREIHAQARGAP